ncbi:MAG: ApaG domain [Flavobacteriales bacterium]|nr:ApaG domain [Flavobacteriales bacterium]
MSNTTALGISIEIKTWFRNDLSSDTDSSFIHNYEIKIINNMKYPVRLLSREWSVRHLIHGGSKVKGEGVVGQTPIIFPDESFVYTSGCELFSALGYMQGKFYFKNLGNDEVFEVRIPRFYMYFPPLLN